MASWSSYFMVVVPRSVFVAVRVSIQNVVDAFVATSIGAVDLIIKICTVVHISGKSRIASALIVIFHITPVSRSVYVMPTCVKFACRARSVSAASIYCAYGTVAIIWINLSINIAIVARTIPMGYTAISVASTAIIVSRIPAPLFIWRRWCPVTACLRRKSGNDRNRSKS